MPHEPLAQLVWPCRYYRRPGQRALFVAACARLAAYLAPALARSANPAELLAQVIELLRD